MKSSTKPPGDVGVQRCGVLVLLPDMLEDCGVDPEPVLARRGFQTSDFKDPDNPLPYVGVLRVLDDCARATGRDNFGLALGLKARLSHLGVVGQLMQSAPTFGHALCDYIANHHRFVRGGAPYLVQLPPYRAYASKDFIVGYCCIVGCVPSIQFSLAAMGVGSSIFHELTGQRPKRVYLGLSRRSRIVKSIASMLAPSEIVFDSPHFGLAYATELLTQRNKKADAKLYSQLSDKVRHYWNGLEPDFVDDVRRRVLPYIFVKSAHMKDLSADLRLHARAINRRLKERGTTLREIVNKMRYEIASQLLRDTSLPVSSVANALGYAETSVFVRAFRRWSGVTPERWRTLNMP